MAKARVVLEDNFGQRSVAWVETTTFNLGNTFVGMDDSYIDESNNGKPPIVFTKDNFTKDPVTGRKTFILEKYYNGIV